MSRNFSSPRAALNLGIATVYQDLAVVPLMPVWRNFFLGSEMTKGVGPLRRLDITAMKRITKDELAAMGIDLRDVDQPIGTLSGGERQCVAIARAVYFGARVLILDEPTAALGVRQSGVVLKYIAKARDRGLGVIFITHNPHHAYPVGDRFMLLRRGRSMGNFPKAEMTLDELVQMMAGGAELEALSHELAREMPDSEVAKAMEEEVSETITTTPVDADATAKERTQVTGDPRDSGSRSSGSAGWGRCTPGPGPGCSSTTRTARCGRGWWRWPTPTRGSASRPRSAYGFAHAYADWRELLERDDVDVVSVCGPNFVHREIGSAVAESGRHLWIEKPAGRATADTAAIAEAVAQGGRACRRSASTTATRPAVERARELVADGPARHGRDGQRPAARRLLRAPGRRRCRGASTPSTPAPASSVTWPATASTWRRTSVGRRSAGSPSWSPTRRRSSPSDPIVTGAVSHFARGGDGPRGPVGNEDQVVGAAAVRVGRARLPRVASRAAVGEQCTLRHRGARHPRCAVVGLPPDGRAAGLPRPGLPGRGLADPARRGPATASWLPSSRVPASRWATTTSR